MRKMLFGGVLLALTGCCNCSPTSLGWRFEVGRAPSVSVPAVLNPQSGLTMAMPLAAGPMAGLAGGTPVTRMALAPDPCQDQPAPLPAPRRLSSAPDPCSCEALLQRLDTIDRRLDSLNAAKKLDK